jgi:hypothetical protein
MAQMSRQGRLLAVAVCLALTGMASGKPRVQKPPAKVVLDYRRLAGAERCPSKPELEAEVRDILRRTPFARKAPRTVRCVLRGDKPGLAARVQLLDSRSGRVLGVRELSGTGTSCEELGGAVALAIALAIDPLARPPRPPPAATVTATPPLPPAPVTPPPPPPPPPPSVSSPVATGAASAAGAGGKGVTSTPPTGSATRGGRLADAVPPAPLTPLALAPLVAAQVPDAGRPVSAPDAGPAPVDAGVPPPDAGAPPVDAGVGAVDAGSPPPDAGASVPDAGSPPDAGAPLEPDAGVEAPEAGAPVLAAAPAAPRTGWRPVVGEEAIGAVGVLPGFAGGVLVHAGAASETASIELEGRWLPGTRQTFGAGSVSTSLLSGGLVGCARFGSWAACGLALAGPLRGKGEGFSRTQEASAWMVSGGARAQWEWMFADPVGLRLHLDGVVNIVRPRFLVDSQEAWVLPPVSLWVGGGLVGRF